MILFAAAEAGAAAWMAAVWKALEAPFCVALSPVALQHLKRIDALPPPNVRMFNFDSRATWVVKEMTPAAVLVSATGRPEEDSLVSFCRSKCIVVTQIIDTWDGYEMRFGEAEPNCVAVIDDRAEAECRSAGGPDVSYIHVGQPAWENCSKVPPPTPETAGQFLFIGQPIRAAFGRSLGYDEVSVAEEVNAVLRAQPQLRPVLTYLLHPAEQHAPAGYRESRDANAALGEAGVVIGMYSSFLIDALLNHRRVVVIQPEPARDRFGPSRHGLLPKYRSAASVDWRANSECDEATGKLSNMLKGSRQRALKHIRVMSCV